MEPDRSYSKDPSAATKRSIGLRTTDYRGELAVAFPEGHPTHGHSVSPTGTAAHFLVSLHSQTGLHPLLVLLTWPVSASQLPSDATGNPWPSECQYYLFGLQNA